MPERRAQKRYVIDGLLVEAGGIVHETVDVSAHAVAIVAIVGFDYTRLRPPYRFLSRAARDLNRPFSQTRQLYRRGPLVVLAYDIDDDDWDSALAAYDVRADMTPLDDVFGWTHA